MHNIETITDMDQLHIDGFDREVRQQGHGESIYELRSSQKAHDVLELPQDPIIRLRANKKFKEVLQCFMNNTWARHQNSKSCKGLFERGL